MRFTEDCLLITYKVVEVGNMCMKQWQNKSCVESMIAFKPHIGCQRLKCVEEMEGGGRGNTHYNGMVSHSRIQMYIQLGNWVGGGTV